MLRATPNTRARFLAFQERARSAFIAFDTHAHAHPHVERFCGPVKIYREVIEQKIHRVFAVLRNEQEKIFFPDLKKAISKELGFSAQQTYRQIIGDSSAFSQQGTLAGARFLASRLNPVIENSIVLYGFTGSNKTSGVTMDVNALTSAWIKKSAIDSRRILANVVDMHTPMAIETWGCDISDSVSNFLMVYSDKQPDVKFGDDVHLSDSLSDAILCMDGGVQSLLQAVNGLALDLPIEYSYGMRDYADSKNIEPGTGLPYLSAAEFLQHLKNNIPAIDLCEQNRVTAVFASYLNQHPLFNRQRADAGTKPALWKKLSDVFMEKELWKKLPLLKSDTELRQGKPVMHSSSTILSTLKESDQTISRQALLLAKDVLTGAIENETVFLQRVRAIYPEFSFYSGTVEGSPDGTTRISGSEQEQRRTELSFLCLYWILRGDYDKLTKLQTPPDKLTYETFLILQKKITTLLHNEEAVDAMFATMAIHDLGKVVWFQNKVKEISKSSSNDHDEILLFALEHCPDILPSYSRIAQSYQDVIRNAWRMRFNLGQFVQGENLPFNLTNCMDAARNNPHIINYFFLHEMLDLGGVTGHVSLEGSKTLNEANCFAYEAAWNAVIDPTLKNEVAVYNAYLQVRGQRLGLDAHDPEQRAVIRLCCNARVFERDQGRLALATFHSLPVSCQTILNKEMNVSGLEGEKGVLLYYAPQTLVNLIENKTGEQRKLGLQRGFELLARLYMDARIHIKKQKGNGVYTLLISAVSNCAAKDPDMLKYKDIEIDFNAGKVISVADHNSIGTETFPAMKSLGDLPGQRLVVIGIGGGSDGIQAKLIAELAEKHGKQVVGTVSVRTKYTTFDSRDVPKGTERSIKSPADALGNDTYLLAPHSEGVHFDRFLENAVADSKTSYLVLDAMKESQTEEENVANLSQQFQQLFQRLQPDMIIALDTGGDALYQENVATESSKSTPDQDLRVIKALNLLNIPSLTMEVATGVDSPVNAQQVLNKAEASYFSPSSEDRRYLLARYHELGMDAATANEKRFGKTALAWQIAMNNGEEKGYHFLPVPASRILDEKSPWNPVVFLEPAMQGVFVMDLRKHVAAISQQPVAKEVEPSPQARL